VVVTPVPPSVAGRVRLAPARDRLADEGSAAQDAVNGAFAVVAVAASLAREAAEAVAHRRRDLLLPRLPYAGRGLVGRVLHAPVVRTLVHPAAAAVRTLGAAADELVPGVARAVLARIDLAALVREYVDLDRLAALLDVDAVVARVDLDAIIDRIDIARVLDRVDLDAVVERVDLDRAVARVDLDRAVARVDLMQIVTTVLDQLDLDAVVERVDLDRAVARMNLDRAVDRVDVDRVIARTDVPGLARYVVDVIDLPGLLRASTGTVTGEVVRGVRDQGVDADRAVERVVDRLLHRGGRRTATGAADGSPRGDVR
jgi:hypothetical protein